MDNNKTIVIDGRTFTRQKAGIGTFFFDFIENLRKYMPCYKVVIAMPHNLHSSCRDLRDIDGVEIRKMVFFSEKIPNIVWFLLFAWLIMRKCNSHILISPHCQYPFFFRKKDICIVTIHDFVYKDFPQTMEWWNRISAKLSFEHSLKKANKIWCNSSYTYQKLIEYYPSKKKNKCFIGLSVSDRYKKKILSKEKIGEIKKLYGIDNEFYLFVGSLEPRKNISFLLRLAPILYERTGVQTLIIGASKWKSKLDLSKTGNSVILVEHFVTNEDLVDLYNMASCYISTSINEGFGMPQLEAMKCGCPVVSPHNSAMIEVVGGYGTLVEGWNVEDWVTAVSNESKKQHTPFYSKKYDWKIIVEELLKYIEE